MKPNFEIVLQLTLLNQLEDNQTIILAIFVFSAILSQFFYFEFMSENFFNVCFCPFLEKKLIVKKSFQFQKTFIKFKLMDNRVYLKSRKGAILLLSSSEFETPSSEYWGRFHWLFRNNAKFLNLHCPDYKTNFQINRFRTVTLYMNGWLSTWSSQN